MTSEHTDGTIVADNRGHQAVLRGERTEIVALIPSPASDGFGIMDVDERIANARRLVAAWNACASIETETLEKGGEGWMLPIISDFVEDTATASENVKRMYDCAVDWQTRADEAERLLVKARELLAYACDRWEFLMTIAKVPKKAGQRKVLSEARAFLEAKP